MLDEFRDSCAAGIAFDHMTVSPRRLPSALVSAMSGQLESEFAEEIGLMEARRNKLLIKEDSVSRRSRKWQRCRAQLQETESGGDCCVKVNLDFLM